MPASKRKSSGAAPAANAAYTKPAKGGSSKKAPKHPIPRAWLPPQAPIPAGEKFDLDPDEYYPTGTYWNALPVFKPTWEQFKDFFTYCRRIRKQGMEHGIVKIVPPKEWLDLQPDLTERLDHIHIVNPLHQVVQSGGEGTYQQTNAPQLKSYTVREWAKLCAEPAHRGPELLKIQRKLQEQYELQEQIEATTRGRKRKHHEFSTSAPAAPTPARTESAPGASPPSADGTSASTSTPPPAAQLLPTPPRSVSAPSPPPASLPSSDQVDPVAHMPSPPIASPAAAPAPPAESRTDTAAASTASAAVSAPSAPVVAASGANAGPSAPQAATAAAAGGQPAAAQAATPSEDGKDAWDYRRQWLLEYLPPAEAARTDPADFTIDVCAEIETEYWKTLGALRSTGSTAVFRAGTEPRGALYGADQCGTLFDDHMNVWNIGKLDNLLTRMLGCIDENGDWIDVDADESQDEDEHGDGRARGAAAQSKAKTAQAKAKAKAKAAKDDMIGDAKGKGKAKAASVHKPSAMDDRSASAIAGVTTPYLYFGMWQATFSWHVEDMDLCSINYIHFGAPKQWYAIPQSDRQRFETAMAASYPSDARRCNQFLRHKAYLVNPSRLASIHPLKMVQHAGEIVLTFPYGYHSGYNLGFNCAESTNFALDDWVDIGMDAKVCECADREQQVRIDVPRLHADAMAAEQAALERERGDDSDFVLSDASADDDDFEDDGHDDDSVLSEVDEEHSDGGGGAAPSARKKARVSAGGAKQAVPAKAAATSSKAGGKTKTAAAQKGGKAAPTATAKKAIAAVRAAAPSTPPSPATPRSTAAAAASKPAGPSPLPGRPAPTPRTSMNSTMASFSFLPCVPGPSDASTPKKAPKFSKKKQEAASSSQEQQQQQQQQSQPPSSASSSSLSVGTASGNRNGKKVARGSAAAARGEEEQDHILSQAAPVRGGRVNLDSMEGALLEGPGLEPMSLPLARAATVPSQLAPPSSTAYGRSHSSAPGSHASTDGSSSSGGGGGAAANHAPFSSSSSSSSSSASSSFTAPTSDPTTKAMLELRREVGRLQVENGMLKMENVELRCEVMRVAEERDGLRRELLAMRAGAGGGGGGGGGPASSDAPAACPAAPGTAAVEEAGTGSEH